MRYPSWRRRASAALLAAALLAAAPAPATANPSFVQPPQTPFLTGLTETTASIRWHPPQPGGVPAAWSDVYQMPPFPAVLLASVAAPATQTTLTGLVPGTEYVIHMRSRAADGRTSITTGGLTFTTLGSPNDVFPCWVKYRPVGGNGFAYVTIVVTNRGATPLDGWALTWTFPDSGQRVGNVANGLFTQTGTAVRVVNMPWNGVVTAVFGTVTLVAQLSFTTANPVPTDFRVNGTLCASV